MTELINDLRAQLAAVTAERDEMLRRIGANETAQLLTEAVKKQCEETARLTAELANEREAVAALGRSFDSMRAERDAERTARKSLQLALGAAMAAKDDPMRGVLVRLPFNLESLCKTALALAAKLPA